MRTIKIFFLICLLSLNSSGRALAKGPLKHGVQKEFYPNGVIRRVIKFKDGVFVRKRTYYQNGRLYTDFKYKNGQVVVKKFFYDNGRLKSVWSRKDGVTKYYTKDGAFRTAIQHLAK